MLKFLYLIFFLFPVISTAQFTITGFTNPNYSFFYTKKQYLKENSSALIKNNLGINISFSKNEKLKFWFGLIYENRGWKDEFTQNYTLIKRNYSYLGIPILLDIKLKKISNGKLYLKSGLIPEILLKYTKDIKTEDYHKKYNINTLYIGYWDNTSIFLGIGYDYFYNEKIFFSIEPNYSVEILNYSEYIPRRLYNFGLKFSIGIILSKNEE